MTTETLKMDLRRLYEILKDESGRAQFESRYPELMIWFNEYEERGFDDSFIQASLKAIWQQEMERDAGQSIRELEAAC